MADLKSLGKLVMSAVVEAEMLGLDVVSAYLITVFDEIVREAAHLREKAEQVEAEERLREDREQRLVGEKAEQIVNGGRLE